MAQVNPNRDGRPSTTTAVISITKRASFPGSLDPSPANGYIGSQVPKLHGSTDTPQDAVTPQRQSVFSHML